MLGAVRRQAGVLRRRFAAFRERRHAMQMHIHKNSGEVWMTRFFYVIMSGFFLILPFRAATYDPRAERLLEERIADRRVSVNHGVLGRAPADPAPTDAFR